MFMQLVEFKNGAFEVGAPAYEDARLDKIEGALEVGAAVEIFAELVTSKAVELIKGTLVVGMLADEEFKLEGVEGMSMQVISRSSRYVPLVVAEGDVEVCELELELEPGLDLLTSAEIVVEEVMTEVCTSTTDDSEVTAEMDTIVAVVEENVEVSDTTVVEVKGVVVVIEVTDVTTVELVEIAVPLLLPVACLFTNSIKTRAASASCL